MIFILFTIIFHTLIFLFVSVIVFFVGIKVWLEPTKGVCRCKVKLNGKVVLITGGNSGIGLEAARNLAKKGARVIIASRNTEKSKKVVDEIRRETNNNNVDYRYLDLSSFADIKRFALEFNATEKRLDVLVNNAGVAGLKRKLTEEGVDIITHINYLGPFLLTNLLMNKLIASKPSRIVVVSSVGHKFNKFDPKDMFGSNLGRGAFLDEWWRYANSKLCQLLWTKALAKQLQDGVTVNALHPGVVRTDIFDNLPPLIRNTILVFVELLFKTAKEGAETIVHLCVSTELQNATGGYYSDCKPARHVSLLLKDNELIEKLWRESVELTEKWCESQNTSE